MIYITPTLCKRHLRKSFAFGLGGQKGMRSNFPVQNKAFGKLQYRIPTSVNGEIAPLCFLPGQLKRKAVDVRVVVCYTFDAKSRTIVASHAHSKCDGVLLCCVDTHAHHITLHSMIPHVRVYTIHTQMHIRVMTGK
jgi:hypothetical protein